MRTIPIALVSLALLSAGASVDAAGPTVQPGMEITSGGAQCTLAWIFDDATTGEVYAATAAHCVSGVGAYVNPVGRVDWVAPGLDFILIKVDAARHQDVDGELRGHPGVPTRVATSSDAQLGDTCQFSGYGTGYRYSNLSREQRQGLLTYNDGAQHYCQFPVTPGDSGGPVAIDDTLAFGIVNTVGVAVNCCTIPGVPVHVGEGGVSLEAALAKAALAGYDLDLRTA